MLVNIASVVLQYLLHAAITVLSAHEKPHERCGCPASSNLRDAAGFVQNILVFPEMLVTPRTWENAQLHQYLILFKNLENTQPCQKLCILQIPSCDMPRWSQCDCVLTLLNPLKMFLDNCFYSPHVMHFSFSKQSKTNAKKQKRWTPLGFDFFHACRCENFPQLRMWGESFRIFSQRSTPNRWCLKHWLTVFRNPG